MWGQTLGTARPGTRWTAPAATRGAPQGGATLCLTWACRHSHRFAVAMNEPCSGSIACQAGLIREVGGRMQPGKGVTQRGRCEHEQSCGSRRRGWRDQNVYRRGHNYHVHDTRRPFSPMLPLVSAPAKACCRVSIVVVQTVEGWSSSVAIVSKRHSIATRWPADGTRSSARSTHRSHQLPLHGPGHCLHRLTIDRARAQFFRLRNARAASYESARYLW